MKKLRSTSPEDGIKCEMTPGSHMVHPDDGMLFGLKKEGRPDTCHDVGELEATVLHGTSQSQKDKYRRSSRT